MRCWLGALLLAASSGCSARLDATSGTPDAGDGADSAINGDDAANNVDQDADGFFDVGDNCPTISNAAQENEDADPLGDVCDPCPMSTSNADGDADGLGDACDPNPAVFGDKLVAFIGFTGPVPPMWMPTGTVTTNNGDAVLSAGNSATSTLTIASPSNARLEVRAALVVGKITATGNFLGSINVIDRMQPSTDNSIACQLSGGGDGSSEELRIFDGSTLTAVQSTPHPFASGMQAELRLHRSGTSYTCRSMGTGKELTGTVAFSPASPRIGVRVRGAEAKFHWVMVVSSP